MLILMIVALYLLACWTTAALVVRRNAPYQFRYEKEWATCLLFLAPLLPIFLPLTWIAIMADCAVDKYIFKEQDIEYVFRFWRNP